jgi:hypothetical protein
MDGALELTEDNWQKCIPGAWYHFNVGRYYFDAGQMAKVVSRLYRMKKPVWRWSREHLDQTDVLSVVVHDSSKPHTAARGYATEINAMHELQPGLKNILEVLYRAAVRFAAKELEYTPEPGK